MQEQIVYKKVSELKNNPNNPRKNDTAVDTVAKSIEKYGFRNPLIIDDAGIVWCGNTRLKAAKKLKLKEVPCIIVNDLTEKQMTELALLDNKTNEIAEWDTDMLSDILKSVDLSDFSELSWEGIDIPSDTDFTSGNEEDNPYTKKIDIPQYQITGECPDIKELVNLDKQKELEKEILKSNISKEQKEFLINASKRHLVFDYGKIAEYYTHQNKEMQELMEKSALVIIDFNDAIKNGYVELRKEIMEYIEDEDEE